MPNSVGGKLRNAPLVYALCQVRFSAVLEIEDFVPRIQGRIRKEFPKFKAETLQLLRVSPSSNTIEPGVAKRWSFVDKSDSAGFILQADSLVFHTSQYERFSDFCAALAKGLSVVRDVLETPLVERVGLRYIDFIAGTADLPMARLIDPQLLGFRCEDLEFDKISHRHETQCRTPAGQMTLRYWHAQFDNVLPPDLLPIDLKLSKQANPGEFSGILDTDHFWQGSEDFDVDRIINLLGELHNHTNNAFRASITDEALASWR